MNVLKDILTLAIGIGADAYAAHSRGERPDQVANRAADDLRIGLQKRLARARFEDTQREHDE